MTTIIIELIIVLVGIAMTPILFYHFPRVPKREMNVGEIPTVSVIIPARNEERTLPLLLGDLRDQSIQPFEIICVDDESTDSTAQIAKSFGARVISLTNKPDGWTGKTWACQNGAKIAKGEIYLFIDADIRLGRDGLLRLIKAYTNSSCTVSVQPYHFTERIYEQFSLLFNLIQLAANGTTLRKPVGVGLYGPIIIISKSDYDTIDGHHSVRKSIIEDLAFGQHLKQSGIPYQLFIGDKEISFRMYGGGFRSLLQGWAKNIASGAGITPIVLYWMVFLWVTSLISVPLHMVISAVNNTWTLFALYSLLYIVWASILYTLSLKAGRFRILPIIFFPLLIIGFLAIFGLSLFKKLFGLSVVWKGRAIGWEDKK